MKVKCCVLLVCGLPSSGKTTLTRKLVHHYEASDCSDEPNRNYSPISSPDHQIKCYSVSVDDLMSINDQSIAVKQPNRGVWKHFRHNLLLAAKCFIGDVCDDNRHKTVDAMNEEIACICQRIKQLNHYSPECVASKFVVVVDDNLYYRSMRYEWYTIAKQFGCGFAQIIVECSVELALRRNSGKSSDECVPNDVIINMSERFEVSRMCGFELRTLNVGSNCEISDDITRFIADAIRNPVVVDQQTVNLDAKRSESKLANNSSVIHRVDCILREIINTSINNSANKLEMSKVLSDAKRHILNDLRESPDVLPQCLRNELISSTYIGENVQIFFRNLLNKNVEKILHTFRH